MFQADLHIHSDWEGERDRTEKMEEYAEAAYSLGIRMVGFSEHYWNRSFPGYGRWYQPRSAGDLRQIRQAAQKARLPEGMKIRVGCEAEYSKDGVIPLSEEDLRELDYVIVPHSHINMLGVVIDKPFGDDLEGCARYMLDSFMGVMRHPLAERITILAHPFAPVGMERQQERILSCISDGQFRQCARAAYDMGIALEINSLTWKGYTVQDAEQSEIIRFYRIAKEEGCRFTYGSDAHGISQYEYLPLAGRIAELAGITEEDMHNIP